MDSPLLGLFPSTWIYATHPLKMDGPHRFAILGFETPQILWVLSLENPEVPIPDLLYDEMMSAGPTPELSTLSRFQTSQF